MHRYHVGAVFWYNTQHRTILLCSDNSHLHPVIYTIGRYLLPDVEEQVRTAGLRESQSTDLVAASIVCEGAVDGADRRCRCPLNSSST